jgi:hypothetical protein
MTRKMRVITVIVAALLWGLSEILLGDVFYRFHIPMRAASLTGIGLMLLIAGRLVFDRPGSSIAVALTAGALRCLVPKLYLCHFIAIALEGCVFDISWTALKAGEGLSMRRAWLSAAIATYVGFFAFGMIGAYAFGFGRWVQAGLTGILSWTLRSGTFASILLIGLTPVAFHIARMLRPAPDQARQVHASLK